MQALGSWAAFFVALLIVTGLIGVGVFYFVVALWGQDGVGFFWILFWPLAIINGWHMYHQHLERERNEASNR